MTRQLFIALILAALAASRASANERLDFIPIDKATGQPVACRVHLKDAAGKPYLPAGLPSWKDHFVVPGKTMLDLPIGKYTYEIERGPEYAPRKGDFEVAAAGGRLRIELE